MKEITIGQNIEGDFSMRILHIEDDSKFKYIDDLKSFVANPIPKNKYREEYEHIFHKDHIMNINFLMSQYRIVCFDSQAKDAIEKLKEHILSKISRQILFLNNAQKEYKKKIRNKNVGWKV